MYPTPVSQNKAFSLRLRIRSILLSLFATGALGASVCAQAADIVNTLNISAPDSASTHCDRSDFGSMQIRIGLHATLHSCFRNVPIHHDKGAAFVTIPREFEGRSISRAEFNTLQADVVKTENAIYDEARRRRQTASISRPPQPAPIPLGIFDHGENRVGYAYAYAVRRTGDRGEELVQSMMRLESFVYVGDTVIVLMVIAPVRGGDDAADTFDLSERWAKTIVRDNLNLHGRPDSVGAAPISPRNKSHASKRNAVS